MKTMHILLIVLLALAFFYMFSNSSSGYAGQACKKNKDCTAPHGSCKNGSCVDNKLGGGSKAGNKK
jgi:hypothetical protein